MAAKFNSEFWRVRAEKARALADSMKGSDAKDAMKKVAEGYERIRLRRAHDEADLAVNESRKELRDNIGSDSPEKLAALRASIDDKLATLERTRQELDAHVQAYPRLDK